MLNSPEVERIYIDSLEVFPNIPWFYKLWWSDEDLYESFEMEVTFKALAVLKFIHTAWNIDKIEYSLNDSTIMETLEFNGTNINNSVPIDIILPTPIVLWKIKMNFVKHDQQLSAFVELRGCFLEGSFYLLSMVKYNFRNH